MIDFQHDRLDLRSRVQAPLPDGNGLDSIPQLLHERPESPAGPQVELMSLDGCHIQMVGGEWKEVKTMALGVVQLVRAG